MIRKAKPSEIDKIITITKACAVKMIAANIFQWNEHYPNKASFQNDADRGELYVLISEEKLIGSITISSYKDTEYESMQWLTEDTKHYYIHRVAIHPDVQGRGNAKRLMDFAEDFARKKIATSIRLDTFSQNKRNQRFYEARGYQKLGHIYFPKQSKFPFYCYELLL